MKSRKSTISKTSESVKLKNQNNWLKSFGPIKTFIYFLAESRKWKNKDFFLTKTELRNKYKVKNRGIPLEIVTKSKEDLLAFLVSLSHKLEFK